MNEIAIVVDGNSIGWRAYSKLQYMSNTGAMVGVAHGFFTHLISLSRTFKTSNFIFVWDTRESKRKDRHFWYKDKRRSDPTEEDKLKIAEMTACFTELCNNILPTIGFKYNLHETGYEGDDLIASIVKNNPQYRFIVDSGDHDLYQLLDNCSIYEIKTQGLFTAKSLHDKYGIKPRQWIAFKAVGGCTTDNVSGVPGFGEKRTLALLRGEPIPDKLRGVLRSKQSKKVIKMNHWLTCLPLEGTPVYKVDLQDQVLDFGKFKQICREHKLWELLQGGYLKIIEKYWFKLAGNVTNDSVIFNFKKRQ